MFFVEPGLKVNGAYYCDVLSKQQMLPDIQHMSGDSSYSSMTAHLHTVHGTPSSCYDVKPQISLDQMSGQRIHQTSIQLTIGSGGWYKNASIKQQFGTSMIWSSALPVSGLQSVVDKAIEQWRPRLRACIRAKGQHFEQLLNWTLHFLV